MPGRALDHFDSLRICYDAEWRAGRIRIAAGRKSRGSMIAESAVVLSMRILNNSRRRIPDERQACPGAWTLAPRPPACLGGCRFCQERRGAAESSPWGEDGLLGGLRQMPVSQTVGGG